MTPERVANLRPFLLQQPYITAVEWTPDPVGMNLDQWRNHYRRGLNLSDMMADFLSVPRVDRIQPWLRVDEVRPEARIIFARSPRYNNRQVDWQRVYSEYHTEAVFLGTPEEHATFVETIGPVTYIPTSDYLELARIVAGAELVCVNQTSIRWLAEGLKVPVLVEVATDVDNTNFERIGAHYLRRHRDDIPTIYSLENIYYRAIVQRAVGHTVLSEDRLETIARLVRSVEDLEGDMAELGCYKGGSAAVISSVNPNKTLHIFDTFQGIPEDDVYKVGHKRGDFAADIASVRKYLELYNVRLYPGVFPDTAPKDDDRRYCFVHIDADIYSSTKAGLSYFLPRMIEGGVVVLDDYGWSACPGVQQAVEELAVQPCLCVEGQHAWFRV